MEDRYARYGAATGIVFVVLLVVGLAIVTPEPPKLDASADEWATYFVDHKDAVNTGVVLATLALFFFIWFAGTLVSALRVAAGSPRLPTIAFGGAILATAAFFVGLTAFAAAAHRPDEVSPELTRALNDVFVLSGVPAIAGLSALFAATALVILRSDLLPGWVGWLAGVTAVAQPLTFGALYTDTGAFAGDGALGLFVPFLAGLATILVLSIVLVQTVDELNRKLGVTDRVRGAVTGAAAGAQAGPTGKRPGR
jgi:Ca2+/Na+ antiporter